MKRLTQKRVIINLPMKLYKQAVVRCHEKTLENDRLYSISDAVRHSLKRWLEDKPIKNQKVKKAVETKKDKKTLDKV